MSSSLLTPVLSECESDDLLELVSSVPDPRRSGARVHPVGFVLAVVLVAFTSPGFATLTGAGQLAAAWPRRVLLRLGARPLLPEGALRPPSEATIRRVVSAVDPDALQGMLDAWTTRVRRHHGGGEGALVAVAIDGKAVRGAKDAAEVMPHLIAAVTHHDPMVIAQRKVATKTSEIPAVRALLADLDLRTEGGQGPDSGHDGEGVVVTVDALHTHAGTAGAVLAAGGQYVMTVKGNTPTLRESVITALDTETGAAAGTHRSTCRGHGRTEERALRAGPATGVVFPGAQQVFRIVRYRGELSGQRLSKEIVHGITSLPPGRADPAALAALVRGHWGIENAIHHVRDVTFAEDASRARTGHAAQNLAALRNAIITAIRATGAKSIAATRRWAATSTYNAIKLLTGKAKRNIAPL